ncbi:hypothetical protein [Blastococcus sp. PRF04-17]|uniref:hypothetical protein n=1 Tax=Blastococcus sp. PRF04-17 TaxID=2933797 RepID=UPI001FF4D0EE|nr:hypothetical protein [Blastococcus sp. PRF04-17]UOY03679.1 hypothetical protein MVA48_10250 [Blastococcus sp. PRF04-17]
MSAIGILGTGARYALGGVRLAAGATGLFAPRMIISRFGDDAPTGNPAAVYGLRLFGVRTILIGLDLWRLEGRELDRALRAAPLIHASDTATVLALQQSRQLSPERARPLLLISGTNTLLSVLALLASRRSAR